jgi:hypothetical protein
MAKAVPRNSATRSWSLKAMSRLLSLVLLVATAVPLFAQSVTILTSVHPALLVTDAGAAATFHTSVMNPGDVRATDIRIIYSIDGDATIEVLEGHSGWTCANEGKTAVCTRPTTFTVPDSFRVTVRAGSANGGTSSLTMTATAAQPVHGGANVSSGILQSYLVLPVETTADAGPGSLRAAIETANAQTKPVKIEFHLPAPVPAEGWFTIIPDSPLPPIMNERVFVDGKSQTRFTGDTNMRGPEIAIDGRRAHRGLEIHSACEARVEGLVLGNFDENQGLWFTKSHLCTNRLSSTTDIRLVMDNYIGTDPTGTVAWPNRRGIRGDFGSGIIRNNLISGNTYSGMWIWITEERFESFQIEENKFGVAADGVTPLPNGAAGMLFGPRVSANVRRNIIANHPGMGIALIPGDTYVAIRENSMRDNGGIGIDWSLDGISPILEDDGPFNPNAPVLISGFYDAPTNRTYFNVITKSQRPGADGVTFALDFYANRGLDGDGEQWVPSGFFNVPSDGSMFLTSIEGDHRGKWFNATLTRTPLFFVRPPSRVSTELARFGDASTSELSNAIFVE